MGRGMGCFSYSCAISRLPIEHGHRVRFFAVSATEGYRTAIGINGSWEPATLPILGNYNDYGSVENLEEGPVTEAFFETLNRRAIERAVGENECHDVAVVRGMPREEWLRALWEDRVQIRGLDGRIVSVAQTMARDDVWCWLVRANDRLFQKVDQFQIRSSLTLETAISRHLLKDAAFDAPCRELSKITYSLARLGRPWDRGRSCGPQFGAWGFQHDFAQAVVDIVTARLDEFGPDSEDE